MTEIEKYFKDHGHYPFNQVEKWIADKTLNCGGTIIDYSNDLKQDELELTLYIALCGGKNQFLVYTKTTKDNKIQWCYSFIDFRFASEFYFEPCKYMKLYHTHIGD